jgi:predicted PurR-regulated permease PerM
VPERVSGQIAYRAVLLAAGLLVLGLLFRQLLTLVLAVLITVIIAIPIASAADSLERRGVPRPLGALGALLGGLTVLVGVFASLIPPFIDETNEFVDDLPGTVNNLRDRIHDLTGAQPDDIAQRVQEFAERYTDDPALLIGPITSIGLNVAGILGALILMLITAYYIAIRPQPLIEGMLRLVPPAGRPKALLVMGRLRNAWIGWMQGVAVDAFVTFVLVYVSLTLVGLDFAIFFAVLSALLVVVPYFGAIVGGIPPVLFALTDSPGKALLVLGIYLLVQQIEGNLTIPLVMSRTVRLHPAVIAVGVLVVGQLFGFIGLIVAVPILSLLVILVEELWVKPMEETAAQRRREDIELPPSVLELDESDDHPSDDEDDDSYLHPEPRAGHPPGR